MAKTTAVTARFSDNTLRAIQSLVDLGYAEDRSGVVQRAVKEFLDRHNDEAIAESYRRAYTENPLTAEESAFIEAATRRTMRELAEQ